MLSGNNAEVGSSWDIFEGTVIASPTPFDTEIDPEDYRPLGTGITRVHDATLIATGGILVDTIETAGEASVFFEGTAENDLLVYGPHSFLQIDGFFGGIGEFTEFSTIRPGTDNAVGTLKIDGDVEFTAAGADFEWRWDDGDHSRFEARRFFLDPDVTYTVRLENINLGGSSPSSAEVYPILGNDLATQNFNSSNWVLDIGDTGWEFAEIALVDGDVVLRNLGRIQLTDLATTFTNTGQSPTVNTLPDGEGFTITFTGIQGTSYGPTSTPPANAGTYEVTATLTSDPSQSVTDTFVIERAEPVVNFDTNSLEQAFDGDPKEAEVSSIEAPGVDSPDIAALEAAVVLTYNGSETPPSDAGTYNLTATIDTDNYFVQTSTDFRIVGEDVILEILSGIGSTIHLADGNPKEVVVEAFEDDDGEKGDPIDPLPNLTIFYGDSETIPSEAGNYFVQVQTAAGGQEGEASANMSIRRPSFSPEILPPNTQMDLARLNPSAPAGIPGSFEVLTDTTGLSAGEHSIEVRFTPDNSQITPVAGGDLDPVDYEVLIRVAGDLYWWPQQGDHPGEEGDGNWNLTSSNWNTQADGQGDQIRWIQTSNAIFPAASAEISNITVNLPPGGSVSATSLETDHDGRVEFRGADASLLNILDGEDSIRVLTHGGEFEFRNGTRIIADNGLTLYGEMNNRHTTFFSFNSDAPQHRISGSLIVREDSQGAIQLSRWDFRHNSWGIHGYTGAVLDVRSSETDVFISRGGAWRPDGSRFRGIEAVEGVRIRNSSSGAVMLALETPAGNSHNFRGEVEGGQRVFLIKEGGGTQIFSGSSPDWGNGDDDELSTITLLEGRLVVEDSMALGQANVPVSVAGTGFASATLELGEGVVLDKNSVDLLTDARLAGSGTLLNTPQIRTNSTLGILPGQDDAVGTFSFGDAIEKNGLFLVDRGSGLASYNLTTDQTEVLPTTLNIDFNDMAFGNGVYLAVADGGTIYRSTDGVEWTDVPLGGISANLNAITYGDGKFVIVGSQRTWVTTTDGLSFNDGAILQSNTIFNDVFYGDGLFVAVGTSRRVYSSPDGENWNNAGDDFPDTLGSLIAWTAGAYVPNEDNNLPAMYVIGGPNGLLLYTTFFESWEFLQPSSGGLGTINAIVPSPVGFSESMLYASSSNGTVLDVMGLLEEEEDSDAEFLVFDSQSTSVGTGSLNDIIALPGRLLTVGNGGQAYVSFNGEEWESIWAIADSESPTQDLQAAAFDAGTSKVMMIGSTGTNLSSLNLRWRWDNDSAEHDTIKVHGDLNLQSITNINVDLGLLNSSGENGPDTDTSYPIFEVIDGDILNNGEPIDNSTLNTAFSWLFNSGNTGWDLAGGANLTLEVRREGGNTYIEFKGIGEKVVSVFKETDTSFRIETPEPGFDPFQIEFSAVSTSLTGWNNFESNDNEYEFDTIPADVAFDSSLENEFRVTLSDFMENLSTALLMIRPVSSNTNWTFEETGDITFTVEKLDEFNLAPDYEINEDADEVTLTVTGRPAAPASLSAPEVTATTVSLAWTDNSAVEEGFVIQRKIDGEAWSAAVDLTEETVDLESFTDTGLEEGTTYVYRVKAYNRPYDILTIDWLSDPSNEITVTTEGAAPLDGFDQWIADHDGLNPGDPGTGMTESFWEDGIPNLLRYALGMSLLEPTREGLPELDRVSDNLRLTFTRDTSANEVRFIVQASEDLASWTAIATLEPGSSSWSLTGGAQRSSQNHDDENRIIERIRDGADMTSDPRRFLRLEVQWDP
ncbi:MAG: MBG domain-containing protein [Opitutales bacterium]|nr:MBG domain-containing protein [Opitutales bacterium]